MRFDAFSAVVLHRIRTGKDNLTSGVGQSQLSKVLLSDEGESRHLSTNAKTIK